ncbi:hypothetical protein BDV95DRAFT_604628 [Massariosphaeria phaeospora]|uniref:Uncharacterized protein n=1 Tax=Massariosphaeria phaeospora TaxID=100035 RepID=A0A7C8IDL2_9PLEO|nr:hypothetical protein BDV95DRAFT_604628 [Massariosphaeria phaeospora]
MSSKPSSSSTSGQAPSPTTTPTTTTSCTQSRAALLTQRTALRTRLTLINSRITLVTSKSISTFLVLEANALLTAEEQQRRERALQLEALALEKHVLEMELEAVGARITELGVAV